jgi:predicted HicB family RNase H-like nuclease
MASKTATRKVVATKRVAPKKTPAKVNGDGRVQLQFRLTTDVRDRLRAEADRRAVSINFLIERALDEGLARWEKEKIRG